MFQESLGESIMRSLWHNRLKALAIVSVTVALTTIFHYRNPVKYETSTLLRVMSTDTASQESLAASMNGILAQKPALAEALQEPSLEAQRGVGDAYSLVDSGPGLVKLVVRHDNPDRLQKLGDSLIQALSDHYLGFNAEADRFSVEGLTRKKEALQNKLVGLKVELANLQTADLTQPRELSPEAQEIERLALDIQKDRRHLAELPRIRRVATQETTANYQEAKSLFQTVKNQLSELLKNYREKHPRVVQAMNQLTEAETRLKSASKKRDHEAPNPDIPTLEQGIREK